MVISALLVVVLAWGFLSRRRAHPPAYPLPPMEVAGARRVGRVWTDNDPLLVVDARAAEAWTGVEGDYDRSFGHQLKVGRLTAAILMPEVDEGPVEVFTLAGGDVLIVSVTAADADDWHEFLTAVGRCPAREAGRVDIGSGMLAVFHAAAPYRALTVVESAAVGRKPFADELLAIPVPTGSYEVRESVTDAPSYALRAWRLTRRGV